MKSWILYKLSLTQKYLHFEDFLKMDQISYLLSHFNAMCDEYTGAPNDNVRKISVRKTIWDLELSEHLL